MGHLRKWEWTLLLGLIVFSAFPNLAGLLRVVELSGGGAIIPENPRALEHPTPIIIHILASFVFCMAGTFQFLPSIRRFYPKTHRINGRIVALAGLLSAGTGLWMTVTFDFPASLQGQSLFYVRLILSALMFCFILRAITEVRAKRILSHKAAMIRAYAIATGASTQAFLGIGWIAFVGSEAVDLQRDLLMISSWALNMIIAECIIANPAKRPQTASRI